MLRAAEKAGVTHYLNHNYRRCPAVRLAKKLIDEGKIGRIFHWRGAYLQSWTVDPEFPLTWQLQADGQFARNFDDVAVAVQRLNHDACCHFFLRRSEYTRCQRMNPQFVDGSPRQRRFQRSGS